MTTSPILSAFKRFLLNRGFLYTIFWLYNGIYLLFIGFTGSFFLAQWKEAQISMGIPWSVALMVYVLILIPIAAVIVGAGTRLRKDPKKLVTFFFCIELPLVFIALVRILFIRQLTPVLWYLSLSAVVSVVGILFVLFQEDVRATVWRIARTLSQQLALLLVGYGTALILFFLPIIIAVILRGIFEIEWRMILKIFIDTKGIAFFSAIFSLLLFLMTVGFFLVAPIVTSLLYYYSFTKARRSLHAIMPTSTVRLLTIGFAVLSILIAVGLSLQPHDQSSTQNIQAFRDAKTFAEKQQLAKPLMKEKESIRRTLRDLYLAQYRYMGDVETDILQRGYVQQLHFSAAGSESVQKIFNTLASPFIYHGKFDDDVKRAGEEYQELFDAHIQDGERDAIVAALQSTNTRDPLKADLLDKGAKRVRVVTRDISVHAEQGNVLRVGFEETYQNITDRMQEVYYEFSLPAAAVITGLWLGPNLEYQGVVAPKGAARRTYEQQVRERIDPALLEQIGPRQYKLRVFPIPVNPDQILQAQGQAVPANQRVRFEYLVSNSGIEIPFPVFGQTRNVFSDKDTLQHFFSNDPALDRQISNENGKFVFQEAPTCLTSIFETPGFASDHLVFLPHGINPLVKDGYTCDKGFGDPFTLLKGMKLALLLDVSESNSDMNWNEYLKATFPAAQLLRGQNSIDVYFFNTQLSDKNQLTPAMLEQGFDVVSFGKTDRLKIVQALPAEYDAVFMVTDQSDFDEKQDAVQSVPPHAPLYVIHTKPEFPAYQDSFTQWIMTSGGGVFASPTEAVERLALVRALEQKRVQRTADQASASSTVIGIDERGIWLRSTEPAEKMFPTVKVISVTSTEPARLIGAHALADYLQFAGRPLEEIHVVATSSSIVTPFSSFIALVDDRSKQQLKEEEKKDNRFQADFDTGAEDLADPQGKGALTVGAVPEPEEWALIGMGILLLLLFHRRQAFTWIKK